MVTTSAGRYPFIPARNFHRGRLNPVRLICIHTAEFPESAGAAKAVAEYFAGSNAPQASAHFVVDALTVVQCVLEGDTAWAAPGANTDGLHIEHAGFAAESPSEWADTYSKAMLQRSAGLARSLAVAHGIPLVHLSNDQLAAGKAGFVGHVQVSEVYRKSDHTDPGKNFPWVNYMQLVNGSATPEDDMQLSELAGWDMSGLVGEPPGSVNFQTLLGRVYKSTVKGTPVDMKALVAEVVNRLESKLPAGSFSNQDLAVAVADEIERRLSK